MKQLTELQIEEYRIEIEHLLSADFSSIETFWQYLSSTEAFCYFCPEDSDDQDKVFKNFMTKFKESCSESSWKYLRQIDEEGI